MAETEDAILTWAEAGVTGYVHRSASIIELIDTAMLAARGEQECSTKVAGAMLRRLHQLAATATGGIQYNLNNRSQIDAARTRGCATRRRRP